MNDDWVKCFAVVRFDIDEGQKLESCYPPDALTDLEKQRISYLSLPDSNTGVLGDALYHFRVRADELPLVASCANDHEFLFGCTLFRQLRDPSNRRGFFQVCNLLW